MNKKHTIKMNKEILKVMILTEQQKLANLLYYIDWCLLYIDNSNLNYNNCYDYQKILKKIDKFYDLLIKKNEEETNDNFEPLFQKMNEIKIRNDILCERIMEIYSSVYYEMNNGICPYIINVSEYNENIIQI